MRPIPCIQERKSHDQPFTSSAWICNLSLGKALHACQTTSSLPSTLGPCHISNDMLGKRQAHLRCFRNFDARRHAYMFASQSLAKKW